MYNTTISDYKVFVYKYGLLIVLILLEHFEENDIFEECAKIHTALIEEEKNLNIKIPKILNNESIQLLIEENTKLNFDITKKPEYIFYALHNMLNEIENK